MNAIVLSIPYTHRASGEQLTGSVYRYVFLFEAAFSHTYRCIDERILCFSITKVYHPFQPLCIFKTNIPYQEMCFNIYTPMQNCNISSELSNEHGNNS